MMDALDTFVLIIGVIGGDGGRFFPSFIGVHGKMKNCQGEQNGGGFSILEKPVFGSGLTQMM